MEKPDCRICDNCVQVDQAFPSADEPAIVRRWCFCTKTGKVLLTVDELRRAFAECPYRKPKIGYGLPSEILDEIENLNFIVRALTGEERKLIEVKPEVATYIASPCYSIMDFEVKVGALASLLEMNIDVLRKLLSKYNIPYEKNEKSLKLLERLLKAKGIRDLAVDKALSYLRKIVELRNKLPPYHMPSPEEARKIMRDLELRIPAETPKDWQLNSELLLKHFLEALRAIRRALRSVGSET